jgi:alkyl sulfatase BDS1-like metallo-beta-lactamase superfamily hydrolase
MATSTVHPELIEHAERYERRVEQVGDRVFVAIGFGLANTIMIMGEGGVVVVDVMESEGAAADARDALRERSGCDLPVKGVIYTHGHPDHVWGARAWVPEGAEAAIEIVAHETVAHFVNEFANVLAPRYTAGAIHMYGSVLRDDDEGFVVNGIGPRLRADGGRGFVPPNRTFADHDEVEIAGVRLQLQFAPGESPDQIFAWLPDDRILLSGDTVYRSYPNIYTIRGARFRDPRDWYGSVDKMRRLRPEHMVPCHGGPVSGADAVMEILTAYRDGIQYVFDQTIRGMNLGLSPDQLASTVALPRELATHPYLRELYGLVELCVREIYVGLYGWFSGDGGDLCPPPPAEESAEIVALAGGLEPTVAALRAAVDDGRLAWAARLSSHVLRVDPDHAGAKALKVATLRRLAHATGNANARNWWLTEIEVLEGRLPLTPELVAHIARSRASGVLAGVPTRETIAALTVRLDADAADGVHCALRLSVTDSSDHHHDDDDVTLVIRHGLCVVESMPVDTPDAHVQLTKSTLVQLVAGERTWAEALDDGSVTLDGERALLLQIVGHFDGW